MEDEQMLVELTADIVGAHVSNNTVAVSEVADLIRRVHEALASASKAPSMPKETSGKTPIVSVRASVKPDYIVCMECGSRQKMLKRHLLTVHDMTPQQYREDYGLPNTYPMVAPRYSETRRALAMSIGLGRKPTASSTTATAEPQGSKAKGKEAVARQSEPRPRRRRKAVPTPA